MGRRELRQAGVEVVLLRAIESAGAATAKDLAEVAEDQEIRAAVVEPMLDREAKRTSAVRRLREGPLPLGLPPALSAGTCGVHCVVLAFGTPGAFIGPG